MKAKVVILPTCSQTVVSDYGKLMHLADYQNFINNKNDTLIKLNLSWTKYFPGCSSQPWQFEGVVRTMLSDGYDSGKLWPVENKTVVTDPLKGVVNNHWHHVLNKYRLEFIPLPDVRWLGYDVKSKLLKLDRLFPEGIEIPALFIGKNIIHLPTLKTHGHTITTGAIKNAFGGLLKETRHFAHKYIHEVMVDLLMIQKEIHPGIFAVMDATVCGDGAGPRTMIPRIKNYILASADCVALDAVAAKMMGFDPMGIPYLCMCHDHGLGVANLEHIDITGIDIDRINFGFKSKRSFVILGDQALRRGPLRFLEQLAFHSPLKFWAPVASNLYHDWFWYPLIGKKRIKEFNRTEWGQLFRDYSS